MAGVDSAAPGLNRAQEPLLDVLAQDGRFIIRRVDPRPPERKLWFPWLYGVLPAQLAAHNARLLHLGNAWFAHLTPVTRVPVIVTCHDLIEFGDLLDGTRSYRPHRAFHIRAAFRGMTRARFIVCVSGATAGEVVRQAPQCAEKIRVIHSGLSPIFSPGPTDRKSLCDLGVRGPYVLYVGSEQPRKNQVRLVEAIAEVRRIVPSLQYVKIGGHQTLQGRTELREALVRCRMEQDTTILEDVPDDQLATLYRTAQLTVLPSLQEGFGFPALEAMACGCPVVVSDRGSLPEISGGAALVVDPLDIRALARAIQQLVTDENLRSTLSTKGLKRARDFTWDRAADAYAALYDEALRRP